MPRPELEIATQPEKKPFTLNKSDSQRISGTLGKKKLTELIIIDDQTFTIKSLIEDTIACYLASLDCKEDKFGIASLKLALEDLKNGSRKKSEAAMKWFSGDNAATECLIHEMLQPFAIKHIKNEPYNREDFNNKLSEAEVLLGKSWGKKRYIYPINELRKFFAGHLRVIFFQYSDPKLRQDQQQAMRNCKKFVRAVFSTDDVGILLDQFDANPKRLEELINTDVSAYYI